MSKKDETVETTEETPKKLSQSAQLRKYRAKYQPFQKADGSVSLDNGDDVATLLRGAEVVQIMRAADLVKGVAIGTHEAKYADRNPGSKRMNAGNILRGAFRRGDLTKAQLKKTLADAAKAKA